MVAVNLPLPGDLFMKRIFFCKRLQFFRLFTILVAEEPGNEL
jgi:hypothetical protein